MTPEQKLGAVEYIKANPTATCAAIARQFNIPYSTMQDYVSAIRGKRIPISETVSTTMTAGKTLDDFRKSFDIPLRITEAIKKHLNGVYLTDQEFREVCGVSVSHWRRNADLEQFRPFCHKFPGGQLLWAQKEMMDRMKQIAGVLDI